MKLEVTALVSSPAATKTKEKTSPITWLVLLLVICGVVWFSQSSSFKEEYLPPLPVNVGYRAAVLGPGLVLKVQNTSTRSLTILANLRNPTLKNEFNFRLDVAPESEQEIGYKDGWTLSSGDQIKLSNAEYRSWNGIIP